MAPLRTLIAALNSERSDISGKSSSLEDWDLETQFPMANILMLMEALAGSCISTQPFAETHPPSPILPMSYVERAGWPLSPITDLACSHSLAAEQVAPGRHLAAWRMSSLLSWPEETWMDAVVRISLLEYNLSSAFLLRSMSKSFLEAVSALMRMCIPVSRIKVSV